MVKNHSDREGSEWGIMEFNVAAGIFHPFAMTDRERKPAGTI